MVQVLSELTELGARTFFLANFLVAKLLLVVVVKQTSNILVLVGHVRQVLLACVEIMLVLTTVVPTVAKR